MESRLVNAYFIGFIVSCAWYLPVFSGIMREQYIWKKAFWTVPYENKKDRASVYGAALLASLLWPVSWAATIIVFISALLYSLWVMMISNH